MDRNEEQELKKDIEFLEEMLSLVGDFEESEDASLQIITGLQTIAVMLTDWLKELEYELKCK